MQRGDDDVPKRALRDHGGEQGVLVIVRRKTTRKTGESEGVPLEADEQVSTSEPTFSDVRVSTTRERETLGRERTGVG